jgi:aminopeptidase N
MKAPGLRALRAAGAGLVCASLLSSPGLTQDTTVSQTRLTLSVRLDPVKRELSAQATLDFDAGSVQEFSLGAQFEVLELKIDGTSADAPNAVDGDRRRWVLDFAPKPARHRIELRYRGRPDALVDADHRGVLGGLPPMADAHGSFLPAGSGWYPEPGTGTFAYHVFLDLPADQRGLVPGAVVGEQAQGQRYRAEFRFDRPAEGIDLMAGPYRVQETTITPSAGTSVRLRTYFHPEIDELAAGYLASSSAYIARYSASIGAYPYSEFSVVSSALPTGFGMPTLTYLGVDVLRLPFIRTTSLGHEILHNWWGNGVYVEWERGNWCEGLTTFMADYAYKEDESDAAALDMRLGWLRDYAALPVQRDSPLRAFTSRTHDASQIVGYNKAAFVFLMLRDELGRPAFEQGTRRFWNENRFRRATWQDLQDAFEHASGRKLDHFFRQWLDRTGAPALAIEDARVRTVDGKHTLRVVLTQPEPVYRVRVPLRLTTKAGAETAIVELGSARQAYTLQTSSQPLEAAIDPDLRLFRRLDPAEIPPILRQVTLDPAASVVLASRDAQFEETARALAERLMDAPPRFGSTEALAQDAPVLIIGLSSDVDSLLVRLGIPARPDRLTGKGSAQVWTVSRPSGKPAVVISARDSASLQALLRPLPHYSRQSWLVFEGPKAIERGIWPARAVSRPVTSGEP